MKNTSKRGLPLRKVSKSIVAGAVIGAILVAIATIFVGLDTNKLRERLRFEEAFFLAAAGQNDKVQHIWPTVTRPLARTAAYLRDQRSEGVELQTTLERADTIATIANHNNKQERDFIYKETLAAWGISETDGEALLLLSNNEWVAEWRKDKDKMATLQGILNGKAPPTYDHNFPTFTSRFWWGGLYFIQFCAFFDFLIGKAIYNEDHRHYLSPRLRWYELNMPWPMRALVFTLFLPGAAPLLGCCMAVSAVNLVGGWIGKSRLELNVREKAKQTYLEEKSFKEERAVLESLRQRVGPPDVEVNT